MLFFPTLVAFAVASALAVLASIQSSAHLPPAASAATPGPALVTDSLPAIEALSGFAVPPSATPADPPLGDVHSPSPLEFRVEALDPEPHLADLLVALMNTAREDEGRLVLARDSALDAVALARSDELVRNNYFAHYGPEGESAFAELEARGIGYGLAGENLARNNYPASSTAEAAFDGLMKSPGHRENILEPRFSRVGVAAVRSGAVWLYVTVFTD